MANKKLSYFIVIGASAGGLNAVTEMIGTLPPDLNIAVFIVLHLSKVGMGEFLVHRLQKYTTYSCVVAKDNQDIESKTIYMAPPDKHLLIKNDQLILGSGPAESRWRPSIDVLFRSAAVAKTNRVIGIILTGFLNDGVSGMWAIKRSGGYCIVQNPNEAEYPDMPLAVLENMEVDHCIPLQNMSEVISSIVLQEEHPVIAAPEDVVAETRIAEKVATSISDVENIGELSKYICPDCGGGLWRMPDDKIERYRCHIGHTYSLNDFMLKQGEHLEATLWIALRMMEERKDLIKRVYENEIQKGMKRLAANNAERLTELEKHINLLKKLLFHPDKFLADE